MSRVYPFGGPENLRFFAPAEQTTSRQDGWLMVQLEDAGILSLADKSKSGDEPDEAGKRAVMVQAIRSGHFHKILAALFVEDGKTWNVKDAEANAEFFADVTDPAQKEALMSSFVGVLAGFFTKGESPSTPSATSSTKQGIGDHLPLSPRKPGELLTDMLVGTGPTPRDGSPMATATA